MRSETTAEPGTAWRKPIAAAILTTASVTLLSYFAPPSYAASAVGLGFLAATWFLTLRTDDPDAARRFGLSLGGLLDVEPLDFRKLGQSAVTELSVALGVALVVFPPFFVGYVMWWSPVEPFHAASLKSVADEALGQFLVIALPEEAFYRGFLQTSLDEAWPPRFRVFGTRFGTGAIVTSAIFALGHVATEVHPNRLAVFFPSLLFGLLRTRRDGIGSAAAFHALCNLFAAFLARSYGLGS